MPGQIDSATSNIVTQHYLPHRQLNRSPTMLVNGVADRGGSRDFERLGTGGGGEGEEGHNSIKLYSFDYTVVELNERRSLRWHIFAI